MAEMRTLLSRLRSLVAGLWRRDAVATEVDEEFRFHLARRTEDLMRSGFSPEAARRRARLEFGSTERYREEGTEARGLQFFDELRRNVQHALRGLRRSPGFAVVAIVTLALGIGANSTIFSLVNGLLLKPLPYPEPDRLVSIATPMATSGNVAEWRAGLRSLERVAPFGLHSTVLTGRGPAERLSGMVAPAEFFGLLGGVPVLGRLWTADEERPGGGPTVVVSHAFWRRLGVASEDIGNTTITLDGEQYTVIGVVPAEFEPLQYSTDVWFPVGRFSDSRFNLIGLRRNGALLAAVRAEAAALAERVDAPGTPERLRFANVHTLNDIFADDVRTPLLVLFAAATFVLLIACANVANLLLARAAGRQREMTVRAALGAGRATLLRQLITESGVLAIAGALVGGVIAIAGLRGALAFVPDHYAFGRIGDVRMDYRVLAFTIGIAVAVTLLAGLAPAVHAARGAAHGAAGSARLTATRTAARFREALMATELALALVLLIGTVLLIRTFLVLRPATPGFDPEDRLVASIALADDSARTDAVRTEFARRLLASLETAVPGARAAVATEVPLSGLINRVPVDEVDGIRIGDPQDPRANVDLVSATPGYFDVVGMRLARGRSLAATDGSGSVPVAIVNETAAQRFWPDTEPIGRRIAVQLRDRTVELVVVGIVRDTRSVGRHTRTFPTAFVSFWQLPWDRFHLVVHQAAGSPLGEDGLRHIVASIDPDVPVRDLQSMLRMASASVAEPRFHMILMTAFGSLAIALALVGCYGVLSYSVAQRTREIGVRVALGASRGSIVRGVVKRAAALVAVGLIAGTGLALAATRVLESTLYGVTTTDPVSFAAAAAGLALVSLAAAYLPARRAAAVQPAEALMQD